jgi:NAD+ synthase (glutamine-hydrolysing)
MLGLEGVDIITNGSGSHWQIGKYKYRHELIRSATKRNGGVYIYSNLLGCEGNRVVFDGNGMIYMNGDLMNIGEHLSYKDVEVVSSRVNLDSVRTYRASIVSRSLQAAEKAFLLPRVDVDLYLTDRATSVDYDMPMDIPIIPPPQEELATGTSRYLWDYLTRSGAGGFFLPLSGGVDSSSTAMIVYYMCDIVHYV